MLNLSSKRIEFGSYFRYNLSSKIWLRNGLKVLTLKLRGKSLWTFVKVVLAPPFLKVDKG